MFCFLKQKLRLFFLQTHTGHRCPPRNPDGHSTARTCSKCIAGLLLCFVLFFSCFKESQSPQILLRTIRNLLSTSPVSQPSPHCPKWQPARCWCTRDRCSGNYFQMLSAAGSCTCSGGRRVLVAVQTLGGRQTCTLPSCQASQLLSAPPKMRARKTV